MRYFHLFSFHSVFPKEATSAAKFDSIHQRVQCPFMGQTILMAKNTGSPYEEVNDWLVEEPIEAFLGWDTATFKHENQRTSITLTSVYLAIADDVQAVYALLRFPTMVPMDPPR